MNMNPTYLSWTDVYFSTKKRRTSHFYDHPFSANLSATEHVRKPIRGQRERSDLGGCHSPFLVSSWQVTVITWAKVMSRQTVILERNEGPMSACQTCSVLTHRETDEGVTESPTPSYSIQTEKIQISLSGAVLLDERLLHTETSSLFSPPPPPSFSRSPPPPPLSSFFSCFISGPTSSSGSCNCLERCV